MKFAPYRSAGIFDETFDSDGQPRPGAELLVECLSSLPEDDLTRFQRAAEAAMLNLGITFHVYGADGGSERIFPFDIIPRILTAMEWQQIEAGLKQRSLALNLFINDLYNDQRILNDNVVPRSLIESAATLREPCRGFTPPKGVWCHIIGTDLVRDKDGTVYVLEDNLRVPSGVSYVLENREVMKRTFPEVFRGQQIAPVEDYPERLLASLQACAPQGVPDPTVVVLTPGIYNSAYFEHSFLAQQMGVELVQGSDLVVADEHVFMRTTRGLERVHVIYRRIDDDFLDPETFRPDSVLGVPGLMQAYRAGNVTLANAPGCGVADDKAIYAYVPEIIQYYLGEKALLPNVPTYICSDPSQYEQVMANIEQMVVKPTNESGGYGLLVGPHSTKQQCDEYRQKITANPRNFVAQPMLTLSTVPTLIDTTGVEGRHVDLRPFILCGETLEETYVVPGGLTRVALKKGSIVVNSSQGGGSKDTWVCYPAETNNNSSRMSQSQNSQVQTIG